MTQLADLNEVCRHFADRPKGDLLDAALTAVFRCMLLQATADLVPACGAEPSEAPPLYGRSILLSHLEMFVSVRAGKA